ncbi:MAG: hypothetical protein H6Q68_112 [Firmicutes bacterium]|nr:hypothetical protein [Bacillota bacterium]
MNIKRKFNIRDLVTASVFAAMCAIATAIKIPFGVGAMVHLGTALVFTIAIVFGGVYAGLAGAIGSAFYDLLMGFSPYTLWSFVIKGIAGLIAGVVAKGLWPETTVNIFTVPSQKSILRAALGCILAATWTLGGYTVAWWQVTGSLATAIANMPSSLMTSGVGLVIALLLAPKLRKVLNR